MLWKPHFERGTSLFKQGKFPEALEQFNQALLNGGETQYILYDSRAAVYTALGKPKDALHDAKTTISLAPQRWHGYARAARLFMKTHKFDASLTMVDRALACIKPEDHIRRDELSKLRQEVANTQRALAERAKAMQNHIAQMPVEIYVEIFQTVLTDDYAQIITLLHVCAFWRQVIWEAPSLWHTLVLSRARAEKKASLWLERGRKRIRELHILESYVPKHSIGKPSFFDDIDWSNLRVCRILSPDVLTYINPRTMFSQLKDLEISLGGSYGGDSMFALSELKSLSILSAPFLRIAPRQLLTCLTSLNLKECGLQGDRLLYNLLVSNPQLESLTLEACQIGLQSWPDGVADSDILIFRNLKTLEVIAGTGASSIFRSKFPALQKLRLESISYANIPAFLSAELPLLTDVSLKLVSLNPTALCNMFNSIKTLEKLVLNGVYANQAIDSLARDEPTGLPCLCPRLRHVDVSNCPDVQTSTLHTLVQRRLHLSTVDGGTDEKDTDEKEGDEPASTPVIVSKLEVLKMNGCPEIDSRWLPWFREHVAEISCVFNPSRVRGQRQSARRINGI